MSPLSFLFDPPWITVISLGHVLVLVLGVAGVLTATRRRRGLAAVLLLAALGWLVTTSISVWILTLPVVSAPPPILAWAQFGAALPVWAAIVVGLVIAAQGRSSHQR